MTTKNSNEKTKVLKDNDVDEKGISNKSSKEKSNFSGNHNKYKNFQGVETAHKVKYYTILKAKDYEDALADLKESKFVSIYAEKRRIWKKSKTLSIYKDDDKYKVILDELFISFINSLIGDIDSLDEIKKQYFLSKKMNTIVKIVYLPEENFLFTEYILSDVIYQDTFKANKLSNGKWKLKIEKRFQSPIPIEYASQRGVMTKWYLKNEWKKYYNEIEKGVKYS